MVVVEAETDRSKGKRRIINTAGHSPFFQCFPNFVDTNAILLAINDRNIIRMIK
jgi:hypothetical protein